VAVFVAVVYIRVAVVAVIVTGAFHAVVKPSPLNLIEFARGNLPGFLTVDGGLGRHGRGVTFVGSQDGQQNNGKCDDSKPVGSHGFAISFFVKNPQMAPMSRTRTLEMRSGIIGMPRIGRREECPIAQPFGNTLRQTRSGSAESVSSDNRPVEHGAMRESLGHDPG